MTEEPIPHPPRSAAPPRPAIRKILIIDDDRNILQAVSETLLPLKAQLETAGDGLEGLVKIRTVRPDLVITDREMPRMDGTKLIRWVRDSADFKGTLVIMLTARASLRDKIEGLESGADDYITKPFEPPELLARVKVMLRLRDALDSLLEKQRKLEEITITDDLTSIYNRRFLNARFEEEFAKSLRYGTPLGCLMFDLDHFKRVNDSHGHALGDLVLKEISTTVAENLRQGDIFARYGGEEFVVLLPHAGRNESLDVAEKLREVVERHIFEHEGVKARITISIGVSVYPSPDVASTKDLLGNADSALYRAKEAGRNRVELWR